MGKHQTGFATIIMILATIVVVLICSAAFIFLQNNNVNTNTKATNSPSKIVIDPEKSDNLAEKNLTPLINGMKSLQGNPLCTQGDNGKSLDNDIPNFKIYYSVPNSPTLEQSITSYAQQMHMPLAIDTTEINNVQNSNRLSGAESPDGTFSQNNSYLTSDAIHTSHKPTLDVIIVKEHPILLDCDSNTSTYAYGTPYSPTSDHAVVMIRLYMYSSP